MIRDLLIVLRLARMYRGLGTPAGLALRRAARFVWGRA